MIYSYLGHTESTFSLPEPKPEDAIILEALKYANAIKKTNSIPEWPLPEGWCLSSWERLSEKVIIYLKNFETGRSYKYFSD